MRQLLVRMMASHVGRESAASDNFISVARMLDPNVRPVWIDEGEVYRVVHEIGEERRHERIVFEALVGLIGLRKAHEIAHEARQRAPNILPPPQSFLEHAASMALTDRAGRIHMESLLSCIYEPYAFCVCSIVGEEAEHGDHARELLLTALHGGVDRSDMRAALVKFAQVAYRCFGRPGTPQDRLAVEIGLKSRSAAENIAIFETEVGALLVELGFDPDMLKAHRWQ
jgi:1,2-phenylacetyl-CoA epoxidase catalytic subunit